MKRRIGAIFLALMMVISFLPLTVVKAEGSELIINDSQIGNELHQISYSTGWGDSTGYPDRFYGGDEHWFNFSNYVDGDPLPSFEVKFKGTGIELYGEKQSGLGIYNIYLDGEKIDTVDAYSATSVASGKLYEKTGIEYGEHTLKVELSKTKNAASSGTDGEIDYLKVLGVKEEVTDNYVSKIEDSETTTSDELFKFKYTGNWKASTGYPNMFSNGDEHYAYAGDYYEITFIGTKVEIYATKDSGHGVYDVYIDDVAAGQADGTITGSRVHKQLIYTSEELTDGQHTIKVMLPEDATGAIQVDFAKVYHGAINPSEITLSETDICLETGMTKEITAEVAPSVATNKKVVWESNDESVATVDEDGVITAVSSEEANTVVTATVEGTDLSASVNVRVVPVVEFLSAYVGSTNVLETQDDYANLLTNYTNSWKDVAWKGDVLSSKIVTCSRDKDVHNAEITASDFVSGSSVISSDNVEIKWLKEVSANVGRNRPSNAPVKQFPDVIYKGGKVDIEPESAKFAWVTINVPKDAKPGLYQGTVTVKADELEKPYEFKYEFEVLDLVQPETSETNTQIQVWQHPFSVANHYLGLGKTPSGGITNELAEDFYFTEEHFNLMRDSMKEYASMGGKDVVANIVEEAWNHQSYYSDPSMVKWTKKTDGTFEFNYTWYDAWINFQIECGVIDPEKGIGQIKCYSIVPWNNQIAYFDEATGRTVKKSYGPGNADWQEIWTTFLTDFMEHSKEKGWFDITYISMDERGLDQLQPAVELISGLTDENGVSFKISSAFNFNNSSSYDFTDQIDDISINLGNVDQSANQATKALATHRKELGLMTTIYTCTGDYPGNFVISDPADNNWVMWYTLAQNTDGFMRWAWDNWVYDMEGDVSYRYWEPGDGWFIYPVEKDVVDEEYNASFYSTPRYEMMKKGIRDINKAKYLMEQSDELKAKIDELVGTLSKPKQTTSYGSAVAANSTVRQSTLNDVDRMRAGIIEISKEAVANKPVEVSKAALQIAVEMASAVTAEDLDKVVPAVVTEFNAALEEARAILANDNATQEEVDASFARLSVAMHMLEFLKGDKAELQDLVDSTADLAAEKYTPETWAVLEEALTNANTVLNDVNAMQEEVDEAYDNLQAAINGLEEVEVVDKSLLEAMVNKVLGLEEDKYIASSWQAMLPDLETAQEVLGNEKATQVEVDEACDALTRGYLNLRLKPNKDLLADLINKANGLNSASYTANTWAVVENEVIKAQAVLEDPEASEAEVKAAHAALTKALEGLEPVKAGDTTASVKTGDNSLTGIFAGLTMLSLAGLSLLRRKEDC